MEGNRLVLRRLLSEAMEECGEEPKLYYQPPESMKLAYPCFVYHFDGFQNRVADNVKYTTGVSFDVTYITRSPTSRVPIVVNKIPLMSFDRYYTADNLHHYVYTYTNILKEV
jgi:hypothetical protein